MQEGVEIPCSAPSFPLLPTSAAAGELSASFPPPYVAGPLASSGSHAAVAGRFFVSPSRSSLLVLSAVWDAMVVVVVRGVVGLTAFLYGEVEVDQTFPALPAESEQEEEASLGAHHLVGDLLLLLVPSNISSIFR